MISWMGIPFETISADIDESRRSHELPLEMVRRLAREKAERIAENRSDSIILAADTIVIKGDQILGKPIDPEQAGQMLRDLRGEIHQVATAISLIIPTQQRMFDMCISNVKMRNYSDDEIDDYTKSGDPLDKAGAYAIQNRIFNPAPDFSGCFASVMGFPFCHIERNLRKIDGYNWISTAVICLKHLHYNCPIYKRVLDGEDIG